MYKVKIINANETRMGNDISKESHMDTESDKSILSSWRNITNSFYQRDTSLREATINLIYAVGIYDDDLVDKHLKNKMFKIKTVQDYIIQRVIQILSPSCDKNNGYENMIAMKPWSYYKVREMLRKKDFVLKHPDLMEEVANDDNHAFWSLIYVSNNIPYNGMNTFRTRSEFWIKLSLLFGNISIAKDICYNNNINLELFNVFSYKYCPQEILTE